MLKIQLYHLSKILKFYNITVFTVFLKKSNTCRLGGQNRLLSKYIKTSYRLQTFEY